MRMEFLQTAEAKRIKRQQLIELYQEISPGMYRYAYRLLGDQNLAEDCVAETFSRFLHVVHGGAVPEGNLRAYLYRIAHNWAVDYHRRNRSHENLNSDLHADPNGDVEHHIHTNQVSERLRSALLQLPDDQRMVVELRFMEEWPHERVADELGKTIDATRALQHRALVRLRQLMNGHMEHTNE